MQAIYKSNVRFADWVKRHACGSQAQQYYFGYTIMSNYGEKAKSLDFFEI